MYTTFQLHLVKDKTYNPDIPTYLIIESGPLKSQ